MIWLGHAYGNDMTTKCLRNDIIMIRHVNDGYIYREREGLQYEIVGIP